MKSHNQTFPHLAMRAALCLILVSAAWIFLTYYFFRPSLPGDIILVLLMGLTIFVVVRISVQRCTKITYEYRSLFESHPTPMWIIDSQTLQFLTVNDAAVAQYGYSKEEFLQLSVHDMRSEEDKVNVQKYGTDPMPGVQHPTIWRHFKKDRTPLTVQAVARAVTFSGCPAKLVVVTDISESLNQQERIREMSLVAENTTNAVLFSDGEGRIKWVNRAFEQTTGYSLSEVQGKFPRSFLHGPLTDRTVERAIIDIVQQRKSFTGDIVNYRKDGSWYWAHLNICPIVVAGKTENVVVIQTDITELKQQAEKIKDQYRRLREMAFMTSHNARSQVTNILSLCDIMNDPGYEADPKELAAFMKGAAAKLDEVIHEIVAQTVNLDETPAVEQLVR